MAKTLTILLISISPLLAQGKASIDILSIYVHEGDILMEDSLKSLDWQPLEKFGAMDKDIPVYWLKLRFKESMDPSMRHGVLLLSNLFDRVEAYRSPHSDSLLALTGKLVDFQDRTIARGMYKNALPLAFDNTETLYLKLTSTRSASLLKRSLTSIEYLSLQAFEKRFMMIQILFVLFTGMEILLLVIFSYVIYLKPSLENISYVCMIAVSLMEIIIYNQVFDAFWGVSSQFLASLEFCLVVGMLYSFSAFNACYLHIHKHSLFWYRVMTFPYILLIIPVFLFADYQFLSHLTEIYFLITITGASVYLIRFRKHNRHRANVFLLAIGPIVLMGIVIILAWRKILPHNFWTMNSLFIPLLFRDVIFMIDLVWGFFRDRTLITIKEREVRRLNKEKEELKKIEELKTIFFNNVSHELRTPLTLLLGPLESVLNDKELSPQVKRELSMSMKNGKYLLQLVNEILDLSKLDKGELIIVKEKQDIIPILKGIIESFRNYARENGQTIYIMHSSDKLLVDIDRDKFEKIIINLLSNAIKYSKDKGDIFVKVKENGETLALVIEDSGIGIAPGDITKIFDRYYQVDAEGSATGTGIGLSIVKEFMALHDGSVEVKSVLGEGSVFELSFPISHQSEKGTVPYAVTSIDSMDPLKPSILVVEDNQDMRHYLDLHMNEYNIYEAANGQEALNLLETIATSESHQQCQPDLILTDYMMPVMDGATFIQKLKQHDHFSLIPVIFLTARTLQSDKVEMLNLGVDDYIIKPFDMKELKLRINISLKNSLSQKNSISTTIEEFPISEMARFKRELDAHIIKNIKDPKLSNIDLADHFSMSERSLARKIKSVTGQTPAAYIREIRLHSAKRKIEYNERSSISEIARELGMTNLSHFTQAFKKRFGKLPSEYFEGEGDHTKRNPWIRR